MAEEADITKGKKKKRRRSARVYINANRPLAVPLDEIAAHFPADDDDGQAAAVMEADTAKRGTMMGNPHQPLGRPVTDRLSPSRVTGGAARSTGDHNDPMNVPGPRQLAFGHDDMRFGTTGPVPLLSMRTDATDFPRDLRGMSNGVPVALSRLGAYEAAGAPGFREQPSGNPAMRRPDHSAQGSMTPPNGGHSLNDPQSHAVANKGPSNLEIMKQHQRRMDGRG